MDNPLIEFKNVSKSFDGRMVLNQVNLKIYEGQVTTIIGKSGVGKSVLLKHIIGLLSHEEGRILFRGKPFSSLKKKEWDNYRSRISYMFQNNALFDSLTVFENIALPLRQTTNLSQKEIKNRVMARIEQTELSEEAHKYPAELSGGMQKRVALARALVTDPQIVLFDEPTTGQDPVRKYAILNMIAEYKKKFGFTAIIISHEIPDVFFISNSIIVLDEGKIIFQGSPKELETFKHPMVDAFIRGLEGLQDELTGLNSKQGFRAYCSSALNHKYPEEIFTIVLFALELEKMNENLGPTTSLKILKCLASFIGASFGDRGFSTRIGRDQMLTVLPHVPFREAEEMIKDFTKEIKKDKIQQIQPGTSSEECYEFSVFVGLAEGTPSEKIESVIKRAKFSQRNIAHFKCKKKEVLNHEKI